MANQNSKRHNKLNNLIITRNHQSMIAQTDLNNFDVSVYNMITETHFDDSESYSCGRKTIIDANVMAIQKQV